MTTLLIVLACVAGYGYMTHRAALVFATRETDRDLRRFSHIRNNPEETAYTKRQNYGFGILPGLFWPLYLPWVRLNDRGSLAASIVTPYEREQEATRLRQRIAELEREAGIR